MRGARRSRPGAAGGLGGPGGAEVELTTGRCSAVLCRWGLGDAQACVASSDMKGMWDLGGSRLQLSRTS